MKRNRSVLAAVLTGLLAVALAACSGSAVSASNSSSASASGGSLTVAFINDTSGELGPGFSPAIQGAEAAVEAFNAAGGAHGKKVTLKLFDTTSSASGAETAVRAAIASDPIAIVPVSEMIDGTIPLMAASKIPVIGWGITPSWYTGVCPNCYSWTGNIVGANTTAWVGLMVDHGYKKLAMVVDTLPGSVQGAKVWKKMFPVVGAKLVLDDEGVNMADSAEISQVAQAIINSGAQGVLVNASSGGPQIQAALNQDGAHIPALNVVAYGPQVAQQFGSSANGLIFASFPATLQYTSDPGLKQYLATMQKYGKNPNGFAEQGYISMKFALDNLKAASAPTHAALLKQMSHLSGYTMDGLICPVRFPAFQEAAGTLCLSASQLENGTWVKFGSQTFYKGEQIK
jgi:ABC-type branched-subunit amino acid transport system substrate-binding protein